MKQCSCEREWQKEKAILEQSIELLTIQVDELKQREQEYKKFNNSILNVYNSSQINKTAVRDKVYKEIQQSLDQQQKELAEQREKYKETINKLKAENQQLKEKDNQMQNEVALLKQKIKEQDQQQKESKDKENNYHLANTQNKRGGQQLFTNNKTKALQLNILKQISNQQSQQQIVKDQINLSIQNISYRSSNISQNKQSRTPNISKNRIQIDQITKSRCNNVGLNKMEQESNKQERPLQQFYKQLEQAKSIESLYSLNSIRN